ncbi:helix-turn-helix domain-containing protein [Anaerosphaera multitolerans]|nr:helix-turn-helix transcriptional regulator [Anaerosphaera multitolerans]
MKGISQNDLAKLCNLNQSTIKDYEIGNLRNEETYNYILSKLK